jgi:two-component system KDP operon response regulator KdpE
VTCAGDFIVDEGSHSVSVQNMSLRLTPTEFELISYLIKNPGIVFSHDHLLKTIWGESSILQAEYVWVFIGSLRKKLRKVSVKQYIQTEPWIGYRMIPEGYAG